MRPLLRLLLRHPRVTAYLRRAYADAQVTREGPAIAETPIAEVQPMHCRMSAFNEPRLNLVVPALATQHVFGGISTALALFAKLGDEFSNLRIVLTDQIDFAHKDNPQYSHWAISSMEDDDGPGRRVVAVGNRNARALAVGPNDRFIATAWWTAFLVQHIQQWQVTTYSLSEKAKFAYIIQDYEPGFYPWSSRYALADATYRNADDMVAIFNTRILKDFFHAEGYLFPQAYAFEPTLNPALREHLKKSAKFAKERRILVYGRPGVDRNAFEIIVMALRVWVAENPDSEWKFVSAGELHQPVNLGHGKQLVSLGKLSLEGYANELAKASIGISLMISPHPSYPPLEMAAFGVKVITNRYKSKDLSGLTPYIVSVDSVNPRSVVNCMSSCIRELQVENHNSARSETGTSGWRDYLEATDNFDTLSASILPLLFESPRQRYGSASTE